MKKVTSAVGLILALLFSLTLFAQTAPAPKKVRISEGVAKALVVTKVDPVYPDEARGARIEGTVVLAIEVDENGVPAKLEVVNGHPMLTQAAIESVKEWRFKPYHLKGEPVALDTRISVPFTLE